MKLEAAAGLRHLCTKDTPSLNISFPYAKADAGRVDKIVSPHSLFFFLCSRSFRVVPCNEGGKNKRRNAVREGILWVQTCQEAPEVSWQRQRWESPLLGGWGGPHTQTHICIEHYHSAYTHFHKSDPMSYDLLIIYYLLVSFPGVARFYNLVICHSILT